MLFRQGFKALPIVLATASIPVTADAATVGKIVTENGGNTYTLANGDLMGVLGLRKIITPGGDTALTYDHVLSLVKGSGANKVTGIYNGFSPSWSNPLVYNSGDADPTNGLDLFTGATVLSSDKELDYRQSIIFTWTSGNLVLGGVKGGTGTFNGNGSLGESPWTLNTGGGGGGGAAVVPTPTASLAVGIGLLGLAARRRRRG